MRRLLSTAVFTALAATGFAQGSTPLTGPYHLGRVFAIHSSGCGVALDAVGAEVGSVTFAPNGTFASAWAEYQICQDGSTTTTPASVSGAYVVGTDGTLTLDPGPNQVRVSLGRDLRVLTWSGDSAAHDVHLTVATKRASGLGAAALTGGYHVGAFGFANDGTGTRALLWNGTITFSGTGTFDASWQQKTIQASGSTSFTNPTASGTCTVAPDGQIGLVGLPGAATWTGAVESDGSLFFATDSEGDDVLLLVGLRFASGATNALPAGARNGTGIHAALGTGLSRPEFCSSSYSVTTDGIAATYLATSMEVCQVPMSVAVGSEFGGGHYAVNADGSSCVYEGLSSNCMPGAVDASGDFAFQMRMMLPGEFDFAFHMRSPLPFVAVCAGDGSGTACPCANESAPGADRGCLNSLGLGGRVEASGTASLGSDTLVLSGGDMPNSSALYFQGTTPQGGGAGAVFGDGLRCAAGSVVRLGTKTNAANASQYPVAGDPPVSVRGAVGAPGSRTYQVWYRNAAAFCTASTFNLTNGVVVIWGT